MIVIEGTDLVGKTSLCNVLLKTLHENGYPLIPQHFGLLEDDWDFYWDYLPFINRRTVMDRFTMSEVVYGNVIRDRSRISPETYRLLDAHMRLQGTVTVVVTASDEWLESQLDRKYDGQREKFQPEQILAVNAGFKALLDTCYDKRHPWANEFACDWDVRIDVYCTADMPSTNADLVESIVNLYLKRQQNLEVRYDEQR